MNKTILIFGALVAMAFGAAAQEANEVEIVTDENVRLEIITPAQPVQETEQDVKAREKKMRELKDDVAYAKASNSMRRGYFVLVADNIQIGATGYRHWDISRNSNFLLYQGEDAIIQFALNTGYPGTNGLGGWTAKGKIRNSRIKYDDNGDVHMHYQVISGSVNANVDITLYHNSKRAMAVISGGALITIYGGVLPYRDAGHRYPAKE